MVAFARLMCSPIVRPTLIIDGKPVGGVENLEIVIESAEPFMPPATTHVKFKSPNSVKDQP